MSGWLRRERASTGARWVTVPPVELDRASGEVRVAGAADGLTRAYAERNRKWRERDLKREAVAADQAREPDLEREDLELDLDRDL